MKTSDETTDRTIGTVLLISVAFLGLVLSRIDGPWWVRAAGVLVMLGLAFAGSRFVFFRQDGGDTTADSEISQASQPE